MRPVVSVEGEAAPERSLAGWMDVLGVPGVAIALGMQGRPVATHAAGRAGGPGSAAVSAATLFQAASISKPVTAAAVLGLVAAERVALGRAVNDMLRRWKIPASPLMAGHPVLVRQLLSHTGGLSVPGFQGYRPGAALPSLTETLEGAPPANNAPVRVVAVPGSEWRYSGGGYQVLQLLVEEAAGMPFADHMHQAVLAPAGMARSSFAQPLPPALEAMAARACHADGRVYDGGWHVYPELAAAGLWTTAEDLLRFALALHDGWWGATTLLPRALMRAMLTRGEGGFGLGIAVRAVGEHLRFAHDGVNHGFQCGLVGYTSGQALAVMTNSDAGLALLAIIRAAVAEAFDWPADRPLRVRRHALDADARAALAGDYERWGSRIAVRVDGHGNLRLGEDGPTLIPIGPERFVDAMTGDAWLLRRLGPWQMLRGPFGTLRKFWRQEAR